MKLAFAGKGGAGKTSLAAWVGDYLARLGKEVWLIDADTALSLGGASGLGADLLPEALVRREDLILERIGRGLISLSPEVGDLPEALAVDLPVSGGRLYGVDKPGRKRLLVMGSVAAAGGGCACEANALLKALLAHLVLGRDECVLVDLEAGVEHLGRGTVAGVDGLVVVSEPSLRGLETAAAVCRLARELGLDRQALVLNRADDGIRLPELPELADVAELACTIPVLSGLSERMLCKASVLGLPEEELLDEIIGGLLEKLAP